jgi:cardiolipin synthase
MQGIFIAIATAKKYVYIHTPYFMPTEVVAAALKVAALGGIDVRIIVPSKSDTSLARSSNYSFIGPMVEAGVRVYLYKNGFLHSKAIVIDDFISTVGTANMDFRSYEQNFEVNAFIYDKKTALRLKKFFLNDLAKCTEVTRQEWAARSKWERLKESFSRLFSPLM